MTVDKSVSISLPVSLIWKAGLITPALPLRVGMGGMRASREKRKVQEEAWVRWVLREAAAVFASSGHSLDGIEGSGLLKQYLTHCNNICMIFHAKHDTKALVEVIRPALWNVTDTVTEQGC